MYFEHVSLIFVADMFVFHFVSIVGPGSVDLFDEKIICIVLFVNRWSLGRGTWGH